MTWGELKNYINSNMVGYEDRDVCFLDSRMGLMMVTSVTEEEADQDIKENYQTGKPVIVLSNRD